MPAGIRCPIITFSFRPTSVSTFAEIEAFGTENHLECNKLKWFEYAYSLLYSGHRFRGKTLDVGSAKSAPTNPVQPNSKKNNGMYYQFDQYDENDLDIPAFIRNRKVE